MLLGLLVVGVIETSYGLEKVHTGPAIVVALAGSPALAAIFGALRAFTVRIWRQGSQPWVRGSLLRLCCGWWHWPVADQPPWWQRPRACGRPRRDVTTFPL
jgi:hypothetical protein